MARYAGIMKSAGKLLRVVEVDEAKLAKRVAAIEKKLRPDVVRIRYDVGEWMGDPCINFRIVLSEEASGDKTLGPTARRVREVIVERLDPFESGLYPYFNFRGEDEELSRAEGWA